MAFQVSPGINVTEIDQTTTAPAVATTEGAIAGTFRWGPVDQRVLIDNEGSLAGTYGRPTSFNAETFFTAASFLAYGNKLYVVRTGNTAYNDTNPMKSATANTLAISATAANGDIDDSVYPVAVGSNAELQVSYVSEQASIKNDEDYDDKYDTLSVNPGVHFTARYPGEIGNSLKVSICPSGDAFESNVNVNTAVQADITTYEDDVEVLYSNVASTSDGSGTGATFDVSRYANGSYTLALNAAGDDYDAGDTITIAGGLVGGANTTNDITANVASLSTNAVATVDTVIGTAAAFGDVSFTVGLGSSVGYIRIPEVLANTEVGANTTKGIFKGVIDDFILGDIVTVGNNTIGTSSLKISSFGDITTNATHTYVAVNFENRYQQRAAFETAEITRQWEFYAVVDKAPAATFAMIDLNRRDANNNLIVDGMHIVVTDEDGLASGTPGTILEVYNNVSRCSDAKTEEGDDNYYKHILRDGSSWIWAINDVSGITSSTVSAVTTLSTALPTTMNFAGGDDGDGENQIAPGVIMSGYDYFNNAEEIDVSFILGGKSRGGTNGELIANYLISNIAEVRKDVMVFVSPEKSDVVGTNIINKADNVVTFRNSLNNSSYAVLDSGYKYMYDRYNDVYRWIPLNGDIAGVAVRTDDQRDPWFSPAGLQRGIIKNIVKLGFNPTKGERDTLYKSDVNPVVTIPGQGTVLFGDKTLLGRPSPFDRINVRRLFIVLEKTVSTAAKFMLFEFNDEFTRAQFKNLVEPFLRDVQGRRGIYDYRVVVDETNNTEAVIDSNQFVGDIYIKPAKSINYIQLNFVAVRSGVDFSEIVGSEG